MENTGGWWNKEKGEVKKKKKKMGRRIEEYGDRKEEKECEREKDDK